MFISEKLIPYLLINEMSTNVLCFQKVWVIPAQACCWWLNSGVLHPHLEVSFRNPTEPNEATQDIRCFSEQQYQNINS